MAGVGVDGIEKAFGATRVLKGVSLDVAPGEFVSLVGPSGCGKTTLMRIVAGLERADRGTVTIRGRDVTALRAADRDVAMVFQNYALYPHLNAWQNMAVPLMMRRLNVWQRLPFIGPRVPGARAILADIDREVRQAAELLGIGQLLARKPGQLSGGQRQRVALGRAIVRHPTCFLMDEPLSNLDAALRVHTRREIVELHGRVGASTLYVTHDQVEAMTMSDRVAVMMSGEILQIADPETLYADPADLRVAAFVGSPRVNTLPVRVEADGAVSRAGAAIALASPHRGPAVLAIRPEHLHPARGGAVAARVRHLEFLGDAVLVHADAGGDELIVKLAPDARSGLVVGETAHFDFDPRRAFLFDSDGRRLVARPAAATAPVTRLAHG